MTGTTVTARSAAPDRRVNAAGNPTATGNMGQNRQGRPARTRP
jgi:hypothetical protein